MNQRGHTSRILIIAGKLLASKRALKQWSYIYHMIIHYGLTRWRIRHWEGRVVQKICLKTQCWGGEARAETDERKGESRDMRKARRGLTTKQKRQKQETNDNNSSQIIKAKNGHTYHCCPHLLHTPSSRSSLLLSLLLPHISRLLFSDFY